MDTKKPDLNLLVTLETLLTEQNVTRAAERLHLSQPAVSTQLSRLRTLFDDPLLVPTQRGMTPTAKALELLDPLRLAMDQVRATLAEHHHFDPEKASLTVAIACTDYLQTAVIRPLAVALRKQAPGVRIALRHLDPSQLEAQMDSGEVDLALMTPEHGPNSLRARHLFDERYVLIGRKQHPRLRRGLTVEQFAELDHVIVSLRGGDFTTPVDDGLAALGYRRKVALSAASFLVVPEIVAHSNFVALVPERLVHDRRDALKIIECPFPVPSFAVSMLWHERNHSHSGQRWLRDVVLELAGTL
ncbi:LysR family transcriptional regulator [Stenotrophomonas maltophilia]|uniref:LysR family transcriptional regulator n=1 Tax=Stenotrophomonas maltophilia (strain K279a) TaxID=522373 RepID=B2FTF2_STRMK|nr:LysR family transcriptional regulator [Stenotrophomonas maltophilia]EKU9962302.1 LysR family transcriptional regulator [Stenotrophomonas maltophilia]MBA0337446.1 LysR family transcriptional regulator [Stenotrophomonas maltophilia]MBA0540859.1 LysR family transcriptional regulator [Stenotrophomonas maltophilia]MBH1741143.1 LysR family transcriptional regulator [Stenotrophomonas maltophilia]MBY8924924.1 LysR family transcriptional regulator [Stenotrophomonas maltophilia]